MSENQSLKLNIDYYLNEDGLVVLTEDYLIKRGHCCKSGCLHCPYGFSQSADPNVPSELLNAWSDDGSIEIYDGEIDED